MTLERREREWMPSERADELERVLAAVDAPQKELLSKRGKSRTASFSAGSRTELSIDSQAAIEIGFALRAGDDKRSVAVFGTGWPSQHAITTIPKGCFLPGALALPDPRILTAAAEAPSHQGAKAARPDIDRPLLTESEVRRLVEQLLELLGTELPAPFTLTGRLADGAAESLLLNGHGLIATERARSTSLRLDLCLQGQTLSTYVGGGAGIALRPRLIAQRLIDRATIGARAKPLAASGTTALLAPQVVCALLAAIVPRFLRPVSPATKFCEAVSIHDDPTTALGAHWSQTDGEGVPARRVQLVSQGQRLSWLRPWDQEPTSTVAHTGCRWRRSWRDLPIHGCSNLVLAPSETAPSDLLAGISKGAYLIASDQTASVTADGQVQARAVGFEINNGEVGSPVTCRVAIAQADLLARLQAVGRASEISVPAARAASITAPSALFEGIDLLG